MSAEKPKSSDYSTLKPTGANGGRNSQSSLSAPRNSPADTSLSNPRISQTDEEKRRLNPSDGFSDVPHSQSLTNPYKTQKSQSPSVGEPETLETKGPQRPEIVISTPVQTVADAVSDELPYAVRQKVLREEKKAAVDQKLLESDNWLVRNGHSLSYAGLYLFSILVLFRPYELVPGLSFLSATAFYFALATLLVYIPSQLSTEGTLTVLSTEVKAILALTLIAVVTMPIAKDPPTAWGVFNDTFVKAVLMFIVMVNVLRTRRRLMGVIWLSLGAGAILSYQAVNLFMKGELRAEGYRVDVEIGGMFGNPNDLSLHLVTMIPIALCLGLGTKSTIMRAVYWLMAALFIGANFVTYSRGGFLGLIAAAAVLVWKLGRRNRLNVSIVSIVAGTIVTLVAPGNYGMRILSIFGLAPDEVGSRDQRRELLERSIIVSIRNPWGIGIGNFPIVGIQNLVTHNAFTQVSSELGVLGLIAYLVFIISPFRKLGAIERTLFKQGTSDWFYYVSIGLQASIVAYMVSSFFVAVAYNWFVYYIIAYAVAFRRIYQIERGLKEEIKVDSFRSKLGFGTADANV